MLSRKYQPNARYARSKPFYSNVDTSRVSLINLPARASSDILRIINRNKKRLRRGKEKTGGGGGEREREREREEAAEEEEERKTWKNTGAERLYACESERRRPERGGGEHSVREFYATRTMRVLSRKACTRLPLPLLEISRFHGAE